MSLDGLGAWIVALPPIAGGIIGYFTNDLAIKMLFRPYRAIKLGGRALPFTPGLIPRNQDRLAHKVSDAIMTSLLTPEELKDIAERLLQTERVQSVIRWFLKLALDQVKAEANQKTADILALLLRDFAGQSLPRLVSVQARQEDFLEEQLDQIFDQIILDLQLSEVQSRQLANWVLDIVFPPKTLRISLTDFLTDRNIGILDTGFREQSSGTYWLVANTVGAKDALVRLRTFLIEDPRTAQLVITDLIVSLNVRQRLAEWISEFSLKDLPEGTRQELRRTFHTSVRSYTQTKGRGFIERLSDSWDWHKTAEILIRRLQRSEAVVASLDLISQELSLILERYLELELEPLVEKVIPILNIDQVIINRVNQTAPADLEAAIQGIVKTELQAIVNLGGILGVVIGLMQSVILIFQ